MAGNADRPVIVAYTIYFGVILLFFGPAAALGRRGACHSVCWIAPFMIIGHAARNTLVWPSLRLVAEPAKCMQCGTYTSACPMRIDVRSLIAKGSMENAECVLCGTCVDACPNHAIRYSFSAGK